MTLTVITTSEGEKTAHYTSELDPLGVALLKQRDSGLSIEEYPDNANNRQCALMGKFDMMKKG